MALSSSLMEFKTHRRYFLPSREMDMITIITTDMDQNPAKAVKVEVSPLTAKAKEKVEAISTMDTARAAKVAKVAKVVRDTREMWKCALRFLNK
jgi:hypothetical protein